MKLNEKILYFRKRAKLSQEELAEQVGVSRQAVSKWELGDATPEVEKLLALARAFGVTTDELLSEEEPQERPPEPATAPPPQTAPGSDLPGFLGRMVRRWGWLAGIYIFLQGAGVALVGGIARYAFNHMFRVSLGDLIGSATGFVVPDWDSSMPGVQVTVLSDMGRVFVIVATVIMAAGVFIAIAGLFLAVMLWLNGKKRP